MSRPLILIIEDNLADAELAGLALKKAGIDSAVARTFAEAMAVLQPHSHDMVLLDVNLPDLDMRLLPAAIKKVRGLAATIIFTSSYDESFIDEIEASGGDEYMPKKYLHGDPRLFMVRIARGYGCYRDRVPPSPHVIEIDKALTEAMRTLQARAPRPSPEQTETLSVEQNISIISTLSTISADVKHTNGSVRELQRVQNLHEQALTDIATRHGTEDNQRATELKAAQDAAKDAKKDREKILSWLKWIGGIVTLALGEWLASAMGHWMGWK